MSGPSAYCGGLYLAALQAMAEISSVMNDQESSSNYKNILEKGKISFETKLWQGEYYLFDSSGTKTIMR
jgi:non-lysosomal glucosylceramidase